MSNDTAQPEYKYMENMSVQTLDLDWKQMMLEIR